MKRAICMLILMSCLAWPVIGRAELKIDGNLRVRLDDTVHYQAGWITLYVSVENNIGHTHQGRIENVQIHYPDGRVDDIGTLYSGSDPLKTEIRLWLSEKMLHDGEITVKMMWGWNGCDEVTFDLTKASGPVNEWWIELWNSITEGFSAIFATIFGVIIVILFIAALCSGGGDGILVIFAKK